MFKRKSTFAAFGAILVLVVAGSVHAGQSFSRTTDVTFSGPVGLPGVTLGTGTYIFELTDPADYSDVVAVRDANRSRVYFLGFTTRVDRPAGANSVVSLGEAQAGGARPVIAWYPQGEQTGYKFIYRSR